MTRGRLFRGTADKRREGVCPPFLSCAQVTQQVTHPTPAKNRKNRYSLDMNEKCEINFSNKIVMWKQKKRRKTQSFNGVNSGDPAGIRTPDTLLKRQCVMREMLSYSLRFRHSFFLVTQQVTQWRIPYYIDTTLPVRCARSKMATFSAAELNASSER